MNHHNTAYHTPVLLRSAVDAIINDPSGVYVDATIGGGGHAEAILRRLLPDAKLIGLDQDDDALNAATMRLAEFEARVVLRKSNFSKLADVITELGVGPVRGILFDLGVSSIQLDAPGKGFSFQIDEPLDMRMDRTLVRSAERIINEFAVEELARMFWQYGEERNSRRIARAIIQQRERGAIATTGQLAKVVESVVPGRFLVKSLARIFQALRIEVNDELNNLQRGLESAINSLVVGGRLVVISYHSLEDRIVKTVLRNASATTLPSGHLLAANIPASPRMKLISKKPLMPERDEIDANPRARSAKMRIAERL
ncbi:MAG: 16S rRNA (cytosine(1402)-N(4))-methyltransferase RsmH [Ignavibacteriales bacterium]|nr:16S rRNA (cytosine(1402)-N(4))-methyltransferase RsmH [Ignavibacteriales bacterium]